MPDDDSLSTEFFPTIDVSERFFGRPRFRASRSCVWVGALAPVVPSLAIGSGLESNFFLSGSVFACFLEVCLVTT